jgi:hypothetical protein
MDHSKGQLSQDRLDPLTRTEIRHVKDSPDACAAAITSSTFPALSASIGRTYRGIAARHGCI